jgi:hypothetical protein
MIDLATVLTLLPMDVLPPASPSATTNVVYPQQGNGFAAYIVGGFFALGLIVLATVLISLRPKRVDPERFERR